MSGPRKREDMMEDAGKQTGQVTIACLEKEKYSSSSQSSGLHQITTALLGLNPSCVVIGYVLG